MNVLPAFVGPFSDSVIERLGWVLVHSLWEFALIALLAGVTVRALRRSSAALRYAVLVVAMAVSVAAPTATWILMTGDGPKLARDALLVGAGANETPTPERATLNDASKTRSEVSPRTTAILQPEPSWSEQAKRVLQPWLGGIVAAWSLGVVLCSARPLLGWSTLRRLRRVGVSPVSNEVLATLRRVSEQLGLRGAVRLLQSTLAQGPMVAGYFRPVILLPVSLMTSIPAAQLEALLAHELAHVRRHDFAVNLLQTLVETLFFYHPAVWWLSHQIRVEREHCCDDFVVQRLGNRIEYGRALLAIEQRRAPNAVLALGAADGSLLSRVRRIVGRHPDPADVRLRDRWPVALLSLACLGVALALSTSGSHAAKGEGEKSSPPKGLEFLTPYPKLHGLSLDMSEKQFLEIVKKQALKTRKTAEGEAFAFRIALGDGHTLIVMFRPDGTCSGIQRVRGEADENVSLTDLVRDFNAENKKLERGLDQPPLTEDEVVAAIQRSAWKPGERDRTEREFAVFKSVAETRQLPKEAYFAVWTSEEPATFVVNHVWSIQLFLPSVDGDGFDGYAIRHTKLREEKIDPKSVAWGKPDADGLSLGAYLSPKKDRYALGERVRLLLFVRNEGKKHVDTVWANTTHPSPNDFHVTDDKGAKVAVREAQNGKWSEQWISGFMSGGLGPGDVHRLEVPYEISFGGDGSNKLVGRVIDARAGKTLQFKVASFIGSYRESADGKPPVSGIITFAVGEADHHM